MSPLRTLIVRTGFTPPVVSVAASSDVAWVSLLTVTTKLDRKSPAALSRLMAVRTAPSLVALLTLTTTLRFPPANVPVSAAMACPEATLVSTLKSIDTPLKATPRLVEVTVNVPGPEKLNAALAGLPT